MSLASSSAAPAGLGFKTKKDLVFEVIRAEILGGRLAPGTRLVLEEYAGRYGVSLTPIREVLRQLEGEGLVKTIPHRGAVVAALDRDELMELYAIRIALETLAAEHAVGNLTDDDASLMEELADKMDGLAAGGTAFLEADRAFHTVLYRAANSTRWVETIEAMWQRSLRYRATASALIGAEPFQEEHRQLVAACRKRDVNGATAVVRRHLERARRRLLEQFWASPDAAVVPGPPRVRGRQGR